MPEILRELVIQLPDGSYERLGGYVERDGLTERQLAEIREYIITKRAEKKRNLVLREYEGVVDQAGIEAGPRAADVLAARAAKSEELSSAKEADLALIEDYKTTATRDCIVRTWENK